MPSTTVLLFSANKAQEDRHAAERTLEDAHRAVRIAMRDKLAATIATYEAGMALREAGVTERAITEATGWSPALLTAYDERILRIVGRYQQAQQAITLADKAKDNPRPRRAVNGWLGAHLTTEHFLAATSVVHDCDGGTPCYC